MAKEKEREVVESDPQTESINVRNSLANPPSQTGLNGYEYTNKEDEDVRDPNRREGLGE